MITELLDICSFLDPRFKQQYLKDKERSITTVKDKRLCLPISPDDSASDDYI